MVGRGAAPLSYLLLLSIPNGGSLPRGWGCVWGGVGGVLKAVLSVTRTENLVYFYHVNQDRSSNLHQYSEEVLD